MKTLPTSFRYQESQYFFLVEFLIREFRQISSAMLGIFAALIIATPLVAQDYVVTKKGKLSDRDFYRLVSCAAKPGGECQRPFYRWSKRNRKNVTVRIVEIEEGFPKKNAGLIRSAIRGAISEINKVGAGVHLSEIESGTPDMRVILSKKIVSARLPDARTIQDQIVAGGAIAMVRVFTSGRPASINRANVLYSSEIPRHMIKSTVLEELIQGLGLLTDIHNRYYNDRSIFSEVGSRTKRLRGQDAKALIYHYPP